MWRIFNRSSVTSITGIEAFAAKSGMATNCPAPAKIKIPIVGESHQGKPALIVINPKAVPQEM